MIRNRTAVILLGASLVLGLSGCGAKEREELKAQVATIQIQLAKANSTLAEKEAALASAQESAAAQAASLTALQEENTKLKAEITALKKRRR
jgi:chromosome segregation ATPase